MSQNLMLIGMDDWGLNQIEPIVKPMFPVYRYNDGFTEELQVRPTDGSWYIRFFEYGAPADIVEEYLHAEGVDALLKARISKSTFVGMEYDSFAHARIIVIQIITQFDVLLDTMHGEILTPSLLLRKLRNNDSFDWRKKSLQ